MAELIEYRKQLMDRLNEAAKEFRTACLAVKDSSAPIEAGWNVHQVAVHTRDTDKLVYGVRARRTIQEDNPEFPNFDGDAYMAEHYDAKEPLQDILSGLVSSIDELTKMLRGLSAESWTRESRHATQGAGFTLQHWVERSLAHIEEHLATVKKVG
ncbi:MAG: DinB family protein [Anaerolineales bacterium]